MRSASARRSRTRQRLAGPVSTAINKSQGQTLSRVGVYLSESCFSHGQLYVAASRVGMPSHIRFAVDRDKASGEYRTRNVVWRDALNYKGK